MKTLAILCVLSLFPTGIFAQEPGRSTEIEVTLKQQQQTIDQQQKTIERLESRVRQMPLHPKVPILIKSFLPSRCKSKLNEKVDQVAEAQSAE